MTDSYQNDRTEQGSTLPTLDRDYIPTVGIGIDSSFLQTVERVKIDKMAT